MVKEFLREWTINILILSIFISILEIILPKGNIKRYVNMIIGIIIIIVIINPFIKLITSNIDIEREVFSNIYNSNKQFNKGNLKKLHEEEILKTYKYKLSNDIKNSIENNTKFIVTDVFIDLELEDSENYGIIKSITLNIDDHKDKEVSSKIVVENIKIDIKNDNNNKLDTSDSIEIKDKGLLNLLSSRYNISTDSIKIYSKSE